MRRIKKVSWEHKREFKYMEYYNYSFKVFFYFLNVSTDSDKVSTDGDKVEMSIVTKGEKFPNADESITRVKQVWKCIVILFKLQL